ncbi:hypothetical protein ANN_15248 [Periplaneta americana]|uniref:Secreted protein n=1 Tax=Periplaneta americana TaxID=6978 RepID=A0ABQ8SGN7_PERAM|nr:hypothetical protein ANN_15248 [Periplaneta americana]
MRRVCARWVPKTAVFVLVCLQLKMLQEDAKFLSKIITAGETWLHNFDPESKQQSSVWKSHLSQLPKGKSGFFCWESYGHPIF